MEMTEWLTEIESVFQSEKFTGFQLRSYRPDRFIKLAARLEEYESSCYTCKEFKNEANEVLIKLRKEEQLPDSTFQIYIHLFRRVTDHLKSKHHLLYPQYYSSIFTFGGMAAGLLIGFLFWFILFPSEDFFLDPKMGLMLTGFIGLFAGRIVGSRKDKIIRQANKRLY